MNIEVVVVPKKCKGCSNYNKGNGKEAPDCSEGEDPETCKKRLPPQVVQKAEKGWSGDKLVNPDHSQTSGK